MHKCPCCDVGPYAENVCIYYCRIAFAKNPMRERESIGSDEEGIKKFQPMPLPAPKLSSQEDVMQMISPQNPSMLHTVVHTDLEDSFLVDLCDYPYL